MRSKRLQPKSTCRDEQGYAGRNPDKVRQITDKAARFADKRTQGKYRKQIDDGGLSSVGPALDVWVAPRTTLDLSVSYDLTSHWQLFGEVRNLTNSAAISYTGVSSRLTDWESFGTAGGIGVRARF